MALRDAYPYPTRWSRFRPVPFQPHWKHDVLPPARQLELVIQAQDAETPVARKAARDELTLTNQRLVLFHALRWHNSMTDVDDLMSAGNCGLLHAIDLFDRSKNKLFSAYASLWIRHKLQEFCEGQWNIRTPAWAERYINRYPQVEAAYQADHGHLPSQEQVFAIMEVRPSRWRYLARALYVRNLSQIPIVHRESSEDAIEGYDIQVSAYALTDAEIQDQNDRSRCAYAEVSELIGSLPADDADLLTRKFGLNGTDPRTGHEIARLSGVSHTTVYNRIESALNKLRAAV